MKTNQLAELLNTTPVKITEKVRSTNRLTAVMVMTLLEMPKETVELFVNKALANFDEDKANDKRAKASQRAKAIYAKE